MKTRTLQLGDIVLTADPGFASGENPANGVVQLRMNNVSTDRTIDWSEIRRVPADGRTPAPRHRHRDTVPIGAAPSPMALAARPAPAAELITLSEAARLAGVHRDTVRAWCARGVPCRFPGWWNRT